MKKIVSLTLTLLLALSLLSACGQSGGGAGAPSEGAATGTAAIESFKTIGDAPPLNSTEDQQIAFDDVSFIYVFTLDGTHYRVTASMPADVSEAAWALDWADDDHDAKLQELVSPLEITRYENLDDMIPAQAELDVYVGKTLKDMLDDGWYNSGWNLEDMEFWMGHGPFSYTVAVEGAVENYEDFQDEDMDPLVIKSVTFSGLGNATDISED